MLHASEPGRAAAAQVPLPRRAESADAMAGFVGPGRAAANDWETASADLSSETYFEVRSNEGRTRVSAAAAQARRRTPIT